MKRKVVTCDICGKDITGADSKYRFKHYENSYVNYDDFEFNKWTKLDMCDECYEKFCQFVRDGKRQ